MMVRELEVHLSFGSIGSKFPTLPPNPLSGSIAVIIEG